VKVNACSGQRGKNSSELSLKLTAGNFAEKVIRSSIYKFAKAKISTAYDEIRSKILETCASPIGSPLSYIHN